jgi:hypothetical protein
MARLAAGRAPSRRLVQHLDRVAKPGHVVGGEFAIADVGDLHDLLYGALADGGGQSGGAG